MPFFSLPTGGASPVLAGNGAPTGALGNIGDLYLDSANSELYGPKTLDGWGTPIDLVGATGPSGPTGSTGAASTVTGPTAPASTLTVGSVTTGTAAVTITGTAPSQTIDFVLPFVTGPTAPASTLTIGTVSTGAASAEITGTAPSQTLNLVLPVLTGPTGAASTVTGPTGSTGAGATGAQGDTGPTGAQEYYATGSAPTPILEGALWLDTDTGKYFVNYDGQFIEIGVQGEPGPTGSTGPASTVTGPTGALTAHKSTHATGGSDALTPSDIGAAPAASPAINGNATFDASSGVPVTITNTGTGNSFVVNDASGDTTPFVIGSNGFVGIGSEPTTRRLTVRGESTGDGAVLLQSSSTGTGTSNGFLIQCFGASSDAYLWNFENAPIIFGANNGERMRLYADGKLDVTNSIWAVNGSAGSPGFAFRNDTNTGIFQASGSADTLSISTAGSERVRVDGSGRVGIGHTTPTSLVELRAPTATPPQLRITSTGAAGTAASPVSRGSIAFPNFNLARELVTLTSIGREGSFLAGYFQISVANASGTSENVFTIDNQSSAATFGVRTTLPLHVPSLTSTGVILADDAATANSVVYSFNGDPNTGIGRGGADIVTVVTAGSERVRVDASGQVGIGVTNLSVFSSNFRNLVVGSGSGNQGMTLHSGATAISTIGFASNASSFRGGVQYFNESHASGEYMRFIVGTAARLAVLADGKTGIGTEAPSALLDINADTMRLRTARTPASASAAGNAGDICWDADYVYVCVSTNSWKRATLASW